jgi:hypothetical protein
VPERRPNSHDYILRGQAHRARQRREATTRAMNSSLHSDSGRVRKSRLFRSAAILQRLRPLPAQLLDSSTVAVRRRPSPRACRPQPAGIRSQCCPNARAEARLWPNASRVRSPIASRSHWLTAIMMLMTRRQTAEPVSDPGLADTPDDRIADRFLRHRGPRQRRHRRRHAVDALR